MKMSQETVVAVYQSLADAKAGIQALEEAKFPHDQVSIVTAKRPEELPVDQQGRTLHYGDQSENQAAKGAGVGGLLGVLLAAPIVVATGGVGAILLAGPIAVGLTGAVVGGLVGAMKGWGIHSDHIKRYEERVAEGSVLVIANGDPEQVAEADKILGATEPDEIKLHAEDSGDNVDE